MNSGHFPYYVTIQLEIFNTAFNEGVDARAKGALYNESPYGLPENDNWTVHDLILYEENQVSGWLLGWWISDYMHLSECDTACYLNAVAGARRMAGLLISDMTCIKGVDDE